MTSRPSDSRYRPDSPLFGGGTVDVEPLGIKRGDVVGVVLLGLGGPAQTDEVVPFLYSRLMDPAEVGPRVPRLLRRQIARFLARRRGRALTQAFELIGGSSPLRRHAVEQARALERVLNARLGPATGATFRTYVAMRHGDPCMASARVEMDADRVTQAILLPLEPQFSTCTTGSSLSYWHALQTEDEADRPTTLIAEYAAHPKLVRAINERIDEALQRFPHDLRDQVQLLFVAHGAPKRRLSHSDDPYCCQVTVTVRAVLEERQETDRMARTAFLDCVGTGRTRGLPVSDAIDDVASEGAEGVLVVPVSFLSDRIETAFDLDVTARAQATDLGIIHFEVMSGLNCHPLLIEALTESVAWHLLPASAGQGDGQTSTLPSPTESHAYFTTTTPCPVCEREATVRAWSGGLPSYTDRGPGAESREAA